MQRNDIVKTIFTILPLTVLCTLYGLWLVVEPPEHVESVLVAGVALLLFVLLYVRAVPRLFEYALDGDREQATTAVHRTGILGGREVLRLLLVLVIARGIYMVGAFVWSLYLNGYSETILDIQHIWADHLFAPRFISIANNGYRTEVPGYPGAYINLLFPPLYSLIIRFISPFYLSSIRAGFFVANLNYLLSGIVLYALVLMDQDRRSAVRCLWFYVILPPSFLLGCIISASTFLLLSLLCMYCARRKWFVPAAGFGFLAAITERTGLLLVVPVLMEFLRSMTIEYRSLKAVSWQFYVKKSLQGSALILIPLGFLLYLLINRNATGNFFAYAEYLKAYFSSQQALFYRVAAAVCERSFQSHLLQDTQTLLGICIPNLIALFAAFEMLLLTYKQLRASYLCYGILMVAVIYSQTGILDGPRQLFCCFPLLIALTAVARNHWINLLLSLLCIAGSIAYLGMYVAGWPVV